MKKFIASLMIMAVTGTIHITAQTPNTLTAKEKQEGWTLLFDGKTMTGWRQCNGTEMPDIWVIENGTVRVLTADEKRAKAGQEPGTRTRSADILYGAKKFKNFELSIDWKVGKGGNSGIFYYVTEVPGQPIYIAAPEVQILDNWNAGDNKLTNHLAGSLYDILPALPQNAKPSGEWNTLVIRMKDGHVTHTQNGVKVCEYTVWTPEWYDLISKSKFASWETFQEPNPAKEGFIGLQDHNDFGCSFRNIKIREL
jgi:hypothetical protein